MGNQKKKKKKFRKQLARAWLQRLSNNPSSLGGRSIPYSTYDSSGQSQCHATQLPEDQFFHWCQGMERKQEEQARKMKELQSHVEGSQRDNDQLRTHIGEIRELGRGIINKAFFKAFFINLCNSPLIKSGWRYCPIQPGMANAQPAQIKVRMMLNVLFGPAWLMPSRLRLKSGWH